MMFAIFLIFLSCLTPNFGYNYENFITSLGRQKFSGKKVPDDFTRQFQVDKLTLGSQNPLTALDEPEILEDRELLCQNLDCSKANNHDLIALVHLQMMERNLTGYVQDAIEASWAYNTDVTSSNANIMNEANALAASVYRIWWENLIRPYSLDELTVPWIKRQFELQQSIGIAILEPEDLEEYGDLTAEMSEATTNKICDYEDSNCDEDDDGLTLEEVELRMATVRDYSELNYYWAEWRDESGNTVLEEFHDYVYLSNKAAKMNGFHDAGEMWLQPYLRENYTIEDFKKEIESLWQQIEPFYELLHAWVREKLKDDDEYEDEFEKDTDPIPASILGNMWAQDWENIYDLVEPFPGNPIIDISDSLKQNSSVDEMYQLAEDFFKSLGLFPMTFDYWNNSLFEAPEDRTVMCHASALDFLSTEPHLPEDGKFRVKMCTNLDQADFVIIHHEMGHTEYQMSYSVMQDTNSDLKPQIVNPMIYRDGANPGFHEAIGDTIALSVANPSHLSMIDSYLKGKPSKAKEDIEYEQSINFLMKQALSKIAFLPYAYILDLWRWDVFSGNVRTVDYNYAWWKYRLYYQGLRPPVTRTSNTDFDAGCKHHVLSDVPYIRYFVSHILQFQFHEKLCQLAGQGGEDNMYKCDIYGNKEAGKALLELLQQGRSISWQDQLAAFLGTEGKMDAGPLLTYFAPLIEFLRNETSRQGIQMGWPRSTAVVDDYLVESQDISPVVPIVVGIALVLMILLVLIAFIVGNVRRRGLEKRGTMSDVGEKGETNESYEISEHEKELPRSEDKISEHEKELQRSEEKADSSIHESDENAEDSSSQPQITITHIDEKASIGEKDQSDPSILPTSPFEEGDSEAKTH